MLLRQRGNPMASFERPPCLSGAGVFYGEWCKPRLTTSGKARVPNARRIGRAQYSGVEEPDLVAVDRFALAQRKTALQVDGAVATQAVALGAQLLG